MFIVYYRLTFGFWIKTGVEFYEKFKKGLLKIDV
jgi:hypothetical protein